MRTLTPAGVAALFAATVVMVVLVEMDLTEPLYLNTTPLNLVIGGVTYYGTGGLGQIDDINETAGELPQVGFKLSGVDSTLISLALQEPLQGKAVRIKMALFNAASAALIDVRLRYAGYLDVPSISDGKDESSIAITSESVALDLLRATGLYYSDNDQQALHPGDLAFQYVNDQVEQKVAWPAAAYFKH